MPINLNPKSEISAVILPATGTYAKVSDAVPFGIYTGSSDFLSGAMLQVPYVYKKLGGDVVDIELTAENVYASYEEAVLEYSYIINLHQSKNSLSTFLGETTGTFDHKGELKTGPANRNLKYPRFTIGYSMRVGDGGAAAAGFGGTIPEYSASFKTVTNKQDYDLQAIFEAVTSPSASAKLTFDTANNLPGNNEKFTLIDASGKKLEFTFNTGADQNKEGIVDINGDGTGPAVAVSTVAAINAATTVPYIFQTLETMDMVVFLDAANVWGVDYSDTIDDSDKIRSSFGVAIDWFTVIGPVNFSLAQPISKASTDKTESFRFQIGTTF